MSRGVDVKVVLSLRDRTISSASKLRGHCHIADVGSREDELALNIMTDAMEKYGFRGSRLGSLPGNGSGKQRVFTVSYEGLMGLREEYLYQLYHQLGINSTHVPAFDDGNKKYVMHTQELEGEQQGKKTNPNHYYTSAPKKSVLPKRVLSIFGVDSSGTEFLSSTLSVATGAGRAMSSGGEWEVQHLPLPSGAINCTEGGKINIVEAFVPAECPEISPHINETEKFQMLEKCGSGQHRYALYPNRFFVNITR